MLAIVGGLTVWIWMEVLNPDGTVPPQLAGLIASVIGMVGGSLVQRPAPHHAHAPAHQHR
jgi:hypothetical protein